MHDRKRPPLKGILLAEAVRLYEEGRGVACDEPAADAKARAGGGDLAQRIVTRARVLSPAPALRSALRHVRSACVLAGGAGVVLALAGGAGAASAVLGSQAEPVNVFFALGGLIGVPTLALIGWMLLMIVHPGSAGSVLGKTVLAAGGWIARRLDRGPVSVAAVRAAAEVFAGSSLGRWSLSALSHALWLAYLLGALAAVVLLLSAKQFTFTWETTILSEVSYIRMTRTFAALPGLIGFPVPEAADVAASQKGGLLPVAAERVRSAWAGFLVGSVSVYGVLPRLALLVVCLIAASRASRHYRLDVSHPGYVRLHASLLPPSVTTGVVDPDEWEDRAAEEGEKPARPPPPIGTQGPPAILGLEIEPPAAGWPPVANEANWLDLGVADDRETRHAVIERIGRLPEPPRLIAIVCALTQTPDRGHRTFIGDLQRQSGIAVLLLLSGGESFRARGHPQRLSQRVADWRALAGSADVPDERIVEIDLDHLTEASRSRLLAAIGVGATAAALSPPIDTAFDLIVEHARRWSGAPVPAEQAELQRAIAALYQHRGFRWRKLLRVRTAGEFPSLDQIKSSAEGMLTLLPARLKGSIGWLAAGASAGAAGCVVAAALLTPAAIVALPAWAGLGAAVAAVLRLSTGGASDRPAEPAQGCGEAVAAAALFALVLHLQGRDETIITAILDRTLPEGEPPQMHSAAEAREWLGVLAQRLEGALATELPAS